MANDLMRIGANIQAMRSLSSLMKLNESISNHQFRLSTGKRINSAQDDTAGYSIAKELQSRVSGLQQAYSNVGNAKSILSIAEGGYQAQMSILQSVKDKVVQASDDALDSDQRTAISNQVNALLAELDDVSSQTKWNGSSLFGSSYTFHVGADAGDTLSVSLDSSVSNTVGNDTINVSSISLSSAASAAAAITTVDNAITSLAESIQEVGDYQARLSSKENTLSISITNTEAVRSTIEDADFAREQMEVMKLQIIQQTALSSFAQANAAPQTVLSLFR
ncbi:MAG: flagellin [FCB group bacterium]|nr:flagellin [FCB group bacterium]